MASPEAVVQTIREAIALIESTDVPDDLRPVAFTAAVGMLAGSPPTERLSLGGADADSAPTSLLGKVAKRLGLSDELLPYFYEEDQGDLRLVIRRDMLPNPNSRAAAMRDVGLLVLAGRQAAEFEEWTRYETPRAECEELNVLDRANFAAELQTLDVRVRGSGRSKEAKLTRHGFDRASELVQTMAQGMT